MVQLEVLDVDALGAQRLRDPRQDSGPVGHVHAHAIELLGLGRVRGLQQPPAVAGGLGDPARHKPCVLALQRAHQLIDPAVMLAQSVQQRAAVVEEDVHPDARVRAGHEHVGQGVRQVAGQRDQPIVGIGIDRDRASSQRADERVQASVGDRVGLGNRCQEPGRSIEQLRPRVGHATGLRAADRVAADELRMGTQRGQQAALCRADVGDGAALRGGVQHLPRQGRQLRNRPAHERHLGAVQGGRQRIVDAGHSAPLEPDPARFGVAVVGRDLVATGGRGKRQRASDQAKPDNRDPHRFASAVRISSATRKARSSDCRALSRGSQSVA